MKKIQYKCKYKGLILLLFIFLSVSCSNELDKIPLSNFSNVGFWDSEQNVLLALTGMYRGNHRYNGGDVNPTGWWSYSGLLFSEMATDNAYDRRGNSSPIDKLTNGSLVNNNGLLAHYWNHSYLRIARCNYFMENVEKSSVSKEKITRMIAEGRFLRAAEYFYLSQHFGSVPLVTKVLTAEDANTVTKASKQDIIDFVITELNAAAADLPRHKDIPTSEFGRASKQTALAFLGRIQLASDKFADAAATYKTIIDFGDNIIDPDYESLFNGTNEFSNELIFSSIFIQDILGNALYQKTYIALKGGWVFFNPLANLVESYEFTDGTPFSYSDPRYNPEDVRKNRDPRLGYTIFVNGATFDGVKYISHPDSTNSPDRLTTTIGATRTGYSLRKYMVEGYSGNPASVGNDLPIIRYAEILLSYLEAKLEAGQSIDQALLDATINIVRGRASVKMPPVTETNPDALRPILRNERRVELACEGLRLWDLLRWDLAGTVLQGRFFGAVFPTAKTLRKDGNYNDPHKRWFVTKKAFRVGKDETWPIPLSEVNINPALE